MQKLTSIRMQWPTDWAELFGSERKLILEIGFGYGAFLLHLAQKNPDANVIGLEIAAECLRAVEKSIPRSGLTNVIPIHSTAETALHHLFTPSSIDEIHVNFPDPWFKKRHSHRRLMQRDTLDAIVSRLQPGGKLFLATDIIEYAEMSAALLAETPGLDNLLSSAWANSMPGRVVTKYEGKAQREGRLCYYFAYQRNQVPIHVPVQKEFEMPHIVFSSPLSLDAIMDAFEASEHKAGETHISILYVYRGKNVLLFEVYIKEPTIDQHIAFVLGKRENQGEYTLKLGNLGYPRSTLGVHQTASILGKWLVGLHPEAYILKSSVKE